MDGMINSNKIRNQKRLKANLTESCCVSVFSGNNQQHLRQLVLGGSRSALQTCGIV